MKIAFLTTSCALFNERMKPLADILFARGHKIAACPFLDDGTNIINGHAKMWMDWPNFEIEPLLNFDPDLVIIWNGWFPSMNAATAWIKARYDTSMMEMGWYKQKTFSCLLSDLPQLSELSKLPYKAEVAKKEHHQKALAEARERYSTAIPEDVILPEEYIFIPMQLEQDTQILKASQRFKTMSSLLGYVRQAHLAPPIVMTNHPCAKDIPRPDFVINMTGKADSLPLALNAKKVIGINSTVLAETMLFNKHTESLGLSIAADTLSEGHQFIADEYEYRALVLIYNQWDYKNPPEWIIQKVEEKDFRPRLPEQVE